MRNANELTSIGDLLQKGIFAIPAYQRDYAWAPKNCEALAEDVFQIAGTKQSHFLGSIVVMKLDPAFKATSQQGDPDQIHTNSNIEKYHVVDGQQRLTSCSIFLCSLHDEIKEEREELFPSGEDDPDSKRSILQSIRDYLVDKKASINGKFAPRLFLNNDSSAQYSSCLFHTDNTARGRKLKNAYNKYRGLIQENRRARQDNDTVEFYTSLRNAIVDQLKVDDICCDDFGSAFQIFESINAKGLPLTSVDLIKCFLMSKAESNIEDAHKKWNDLQETVGATPDDTTALNKFMLAFLFTENGERVLGRNAYNTFSDLFRDASYIDIFHQLQTAANSYKALALDSSKWAEDDPRKAFSVLDLTSIYVPLLAFARQCEDGANNPELKKLEKLLLPFAIRYQICGRPSNALDSPFKEMISSSKDTSSAESVFKHIKPLMPSNDQFRESFKELTFNDQKEALAKYILEQIELFLERNQGSEKRIPGSFTLEHIIPKKFSEYIEEWNDYSLPEGFETEVIRSIGNMVLIGGKDNTSASNQPYSKKIKSYTTGHRTSSTSPVEGYNLLRQLIETYPESFEIDDVYDRAKYLADQAVAIWQ